MSLCLTGMFVTAMNAGQCDTLLKVAIRVDGVYGRNLVLEVQSTIYNPYVYRFHFVTLIRASFTPVMALRALGTHIDSPKARARWS